MNRLETLFDTIYATDLVYGQHCWKQCGDAHCCNFARYQTGKVHQTIVLLPYELAYMKKRGYLGQYKSYEHFFREYKLDCATIRFEQISVEVAPGQCPCTHEIRPTTCRLYPMLPLFDLRGGLLGIQPYYALEDELERAVGVPTTCRIERISPAELAVLIAIARAIASDPNCLFHMMAYERTRVHVQAALARRQQEPRRRINPTPEAMARALKTLGIELMTGSLVDLKRLKADLDDLARQFVETYGPDFQSAALDA